MTAESRPLGRPLYRLMEQARALLNPLAPVSILLGLSGGGDSTALFHVLLELRRQKLVKSLRAAHVNHRWRGSESDSDERFCRELARHYGIPILVHRALAGTPKTEAIAREARHRLFLARRRKDEWIALAHTRDDQAETVLWRLARGGGADALSGLRETEPPYLRPFLHVTRDDIRRALEQAKLSWREDATNETADRTRTFIRHELIPRLEQVHPGAARHLSELARREGELSDWAQARATAELKLRLRTDGSLDAAVFSLGPLVGRELLARWWRQTGLPDTALTDARLRDLESLALGLSAGPLPAPGDREIRRRGGTLFVARKTVPKASGRKPPKASGRRK